MDRAEEQTWPVSGAENRQVAERLREAAEILELQGANPFRVAAYRRAAGVVAALPRDVREIFAEEGEKGLDALPGIGTAIAAAIAQMLRTGRWAQLERLRGEAEPETLFQSLPGVGPELARRICGTLQVDTLEALEVAAHDGRLETVPGIGRRRAAILRAALAERLSRTRPPRGRGPREPDVAALLDVDREYREKADRDTLPKIAPRRFNPTGEAWLPVLHADRGEWRFTALYSNTARAHELGLVRDWVVLYFSADRHAEGQRTVVTETRGPLKGKRVVRGREQESAAFYEAASAPGFARKTRKR